MTVLLAIVGDGATEAHVVRSASGSLMSCPDPSVVHSSAGRYRYYLACTSDYDPDAFPIWGSDNLEHWNLVGHVFPAGTHPWWGLPAPVGRYWGPALYRIDGRWVVYFAAEYNPSALRLPLDPGTLAIGVATSRSITGPWRASLLHWRGQFNRVNRERETYGGVIDPSMVQDPTTGQRYLFWAEEHTSIWVAKLSSDGLRLDPHIHEAMWARRGWECAGGGCVVEGPEECYHGGWLYMFYSGGSTWKGTYAVGAAVSADPLVGQFVRLAADPVLRSGDGWVGPGGTSAPVVGPNGRTYILYHVETGPNPRHNSAERYLMVSPLTWQGVGGYYPLINDGLPG